MSKEKTYLKYALGFITILLIIFGLSLVIATILSILGMMQMTLFKQGDVAFEFSITGKRSVLTMVTSLISSYIIFSVLYCVRLFFKNIINEQIFVKANVTIAKITSLLLLLATFLTEGLITVNGYSFFNLTYLVTALVVWTLSMILEKANQIAEENEFTI